MQQVAASLRGEYSDGEPCLFAFNNVLPQPPDAPSSWAEKNWGTYRYPIYCEISDDGSDGEFFMTFQSFNLPPNGVVATLAAEHPDLHFELDWSTPDWSLAGNYVFDAGALTDEDIWGEDDEGEEDEEQLENDDVSDAGDEPSPTAPIGRRSRRSSLAADANEQP